MEEREKRKGTRTRKGKWKKEKEQESRYYANKQTGEEVYGVWKLRFDGICPKYGRDIAGHKMKGLKSRRSCDKLLFSTCPSTKPELVLKFGVKYFLE